jgi:hypothetical protein
MGENGYGNDAMDTDEVQIVFYIGSISAWTMQASGHMGKAPELIRGSVV